MSVLGWWQNGVGGWVGRNSAGYFDSERCASLRMTGGTTIFGRVPLLGKGSGLLALGGVGAVYHGLSGSGEVRPNL
jgi:hypothetical protein